MKGAPVESILALRSSCAVVQVCGLAKHFTLRLCDNIAQAIDERAASEGRTRSSMVNHILTLALFREAQDKRTVAKVAESLEDAGARPFEPVPQVLKKVRMCQKHNQPAESFSGMSCKQDRQAKLDRFSC